MLKHINIAVALLFACPLTGFAKNGIDTQHPILAVIPLDARKVDTNDAKTIGDEIAIKIMRTNRFRVIEREKIAKILEEQSFQRSGACNSNECAVEIGKLLGVNRIVAGSVSSLGTSFVLSVRMIDVETGELISSYSKTNFARLEDVINIGTTNAASELVAINLQTDNSTTLNVPQSKTEMHPTNLMNSSSPLQQQTQGTSVLRIAGISITGIGAAVAIFGIYDHNRAEEIGAEPSWLPAQVGVGALAIGLAMIGLSYSF